MLSVQHLDWPPSASIHEEATVSVAVLLYNSLVIFDQHVAKDSLESVVPELATKWAGRPTTPIARRRQALATIWRISDGHALGRA